MIKITDATNTEEYRELQVKLWRSLTVRAINNDLDYEEFKEWLIKDSLLILNKQKIKEQSYKANKFIKESD